ncbi:MAG TPA: 4-carboxy-4-hydroxy-2-oxoadipate aldolase/oxaloacetate decarboxylase [Aldersonia sp.]
MHTESLPSPVAHDAVLQRLQALDSTLISDALDALGLPSGTGALQPLGASVPVAGRVRTVELGPATPGAAPGPHIATQAIAAASAGDVIVVANDGRTDVSCWGGLLSLGAAQRGVRGVVVDGACRDVAEARELGFPVFARGVTPRTARTRLAQIAVAGTVVIDEIPVNDGDYVVADDSGIAFVPAARVHEILDRAEWAQRCEAAIAADIRAGVGIDEAMHDARLTAQTDTETNR